MRVRYMVVVPENFAGLVAFGLNFIPPPISGNGGKRGQHSEGLH